MKHLSTAVLLLALLAAGCGDASVTTTAQPASTSTTAGPDDPLDPVLCDRNNTTDCATVGFVFESPAPLSEVLDRLDGWLVVAVFRADPTCVVVPNWPDNEDGVHEESRFAYVDAPLIRERRLNAPGSPPITGHHIASGYWDHFEAEWRAALQDDAVITTAVVYAPIDTTVTNAGVDDVTEVVPIPSYRADTTDERFPGELYIEAHEIPAELGGPRERMVCDR